MPFGYFGAYFEVQEPQEPTKGLEYDISVPLSERIIGSLSPNVSPKEDLSPGRLLRAMALAVWCPSNTTGMICLKSELQPSYTTPAKLTYGQLLDMFLQPAESFPELDVLRGCLARITLRNQSGRAQTYESIPASYEARGTRDHELPECLQDLADEINEDVREACFALDDPDIWYPGVDEGIEPVPDDHVDLVIWALQRELDRELRGPSASTNWSSSASLPSVPLSELPRRVQRALAERRRLRFKQWGIGREQWESGYFSLWDIPEGPDYVPRRAERLLANTG